MAKGSKNKTKIGLGLESSFGGGAATNFLAMANDYSYEFGGDVVFNEAMIGSTYQQNAATRDIRMINFTATIKIDENTLPLLYAQKYTISSAAVSGDSGAYEHTLAYSNANYKNSLQVSIEDGDLGGDVIQGYMISSINITPEAGQFVIAEIEGTGIYLEGSGVSLAVGDVTREFVSRHSNFQLVASGSSFADYDVKTASYMHEFTLSDEATNFNLGSQEMDEQYIVQDTYSAELSALMSNKTLRGYYENATHLKYKHILTDTNRIIVGSTASTNPLISFEYPRAVVEALTEREGSAAEMMRQSFTLRALDVPTVSDTPMKIVVRNNVASY